MDVCSLFIQLTFVVSIFQVKQCGITWEQKECNKFRDQIKIRLSPHSTHSPKQVFTPKWDKDSSCQGSAEGGKKKIKKVYAG